MSKSHTSPCILNEVTNSAMFVIHAQIGVVSVGLCKGHIALQKCVLHRLRQSFPHQTVLPTGAIKQQSGAILRNQPSCWFFVHNLPCDNHCGARYAILICYVCFWYLLFCADVIKS
jgi:hypothetical protein